MKALIVLILGMFVPSLGAAPIAVGQHQGITVILTDEPCALDAVVNLPYRVTWQEGSKTSEGCFTVHGTTVIAYFDDKTIGVFSVQDFVRARGA